MMRGQEALTAPEHGTMRVAVLLLLHAVAGLSASSGANKQVSAAVG